MRKRQKLVFSTVLLCVGMGASFSAPVELKYWWFLGLTLANWLLAAWSLKEGLAGVEWVTVLIPPVVFTLAVGLFSVLLPQTLAMRAGLVGLYGVGQYALLLTANIFSVAAIRTIALFRAATAVGFSLAILSGFLLYDSILSFRLPFWGNAILVGLGSWLIILPGLWSMKLEAKLEKRLVSFCVWLAVVMGLLAGAISFWPVQAAVGGLFLSTGLYVFLGISQHHFQERLYTRTVWEYTLVGLVVLVTILLTTGYVGG